MINRRIMPMGPLSGPGGEGWLTRPRHLKEQVTLAR
jgi:hypothetical protein